GMLSSVAIIDATAKSIAASGPKIPRVIDPVMRAKGGHALLADDAAAALKKLLIVGAAVVTPNLPEAEALTGRRITTVAEMDAAVPVLRQLGADAVLLKGGHLEGDHIVDLLITKADLIRFEDARIKTTSTHGTGCTLASAIAVSLAQGINLKE